MDDGNVETNKERVQQNEKERNDEANAATETSTTNAEQHTAQKATDGQNAEVEKEDQFREVDSEQQGEEDGDQTEGEMVKGNQKEDGKEMEGVTGQQRATKDGFQMEVQTELVVFQKEQFFEVDEHLRPEDFLPGREPALEYHGTTENTDARMEKNQTEAEGCLFNKEGSPLSQMEINEDGVFQEVKKKGRNKKGEIPLSLVTRSQASKLNNSSWQ